MMRSAWLFLLLMFAFQIPGQTVVDPLPYASIAVPIPDTLDQLYRDSINLKFSPIRINQAGYRPQDDKFFYYVAYSGTPSGFKVIDNATGATVGTGTFSSTTFNCSSQLKIKASNNAQIVGGGDTRYTMESKLYDGSLYQGKLPTLTPGAYRVVVGSDTSAKFVVDEKLYSWVRDALIKFYGVNRCGNDNSWFHKDCHLQDPVIGGWHDCGDHLKEGLTMGYTAAVLGLCAAVFKDRDHDVYAANQGLTRVTDGIPDILYEAKHGSDFILSSYDKAGGQVGNMITSVANFGEDHNWWGRPENQDKMPPVRGGPPRDARVEVGGNIIGNYAANLALVSKIIRPYDSKYADRCVKAAKDIYAFAKAHSDSASSSPAYSGNNKTYDKLALAAVALIYATGEKAYLNDLCYDKTIGTKGTPTTFPKFSYEGGWFAKDNPDFEHYSANSDWASVQMYATYGFFKLVLMNEALCDSLGISDSERKALIEKTIYSAAMDLGQIGNTGDLTVTIPNNSGWVPNDIKVEQPWMLMHTQMEWVWNRYQAGNITDMFCYYDMAKKLQEMGIDLPNTPASTDWKAEDIKKIIIRQLDYMLGVNPWDISMVYGVGSKNFNHPHHRAANPEGKNVPGAFYKYMPPVGALQGGYKPTTTTNVYSEFWGDYQHSETGIDGTTALLLPVTGLAKEDSITNPSGTVKIVYVGCDKAIIEIHQSRYGKSSIYYGVNGNTSQVKTSDSADITHRFELTGLQNGTVYSFYVKVSDIFGRDSTIMDLDEDKKLVNFEFKTLQNCPTNADIAKVKVCKVTSDSAEIFWYTPNGEFDSKVVYGESIPPKTVNDVDESGHPTKLHYVKIGGLKEKTTYYFFVQSGESIDDNQGKYYTFTTPVEHVNFDVRAVRYTWENMPAMGLGIINQDVKAYDSLDARLYFRAKDGFEKDLAARLDIVIRYREDGFQDSVTGDLKNQILQNIYNQKATKMPDTYNPQDSTYAYYFAVPLWGFEMRSQSRIRMDLVFDTWEPLRLKDHLNQPPQHVITDKDWSFGPHSTANGDPVNFPGVPIVTNKDDIDNNYWNLPIDYYICIYRKGEFVWGYSPSKTEMGTKKTYYTVDSHITSPVNNPTQEDTVLTQVAKNITIKGWAKVSPVDGKINDIWVNGVPVNKLSSVISWNAAEQRYDFSIPASVSGEFNEFDVTIFAGPDETCTECYGCANYNHHFNLQYVGSKPYPSTLTLKDMNMQNIPNNDTAHIDTTKFNVVVTDRNGNQHGKSVDTVYVTVKNPTLGDSTTIPLVETGDSTGTFQSSYAISVVNKTADQTGATEIAMTGGDKIWITYVDPTDPTDSSQAVLVSKANFPVAIKGALFDTNGDGKIDKMTVNYSIPLKTTPDSIAFSFPSQTDTRVLRSQTETFSTNGNELDISFTSSGNTCITGFTSGSRGSGKSYLTNSGATKISLFDLYDSIGPVIAKSPILYENRGTSYDTLTVAFSEEIGMGTKKDSILMLRHNGSDYGVNLITILSQDANTNTMKLLVESNVKLAEGDSLYINPTGSITDNLNNHASRNNQHVPIILKAAPPVIKNAFYTDSNGDGIIDRVEVTFDKSVVLNDMVFGFRWNSDARVTVPSSSASLIGTDGKSVALDVKGLVSGNQITTGGNMVLSALNINFLKDTNSINVTDKAAPVILLAELTPSSQLNGSIIDTLRVQFSEPIQTISSSQAFTFYNLTKNSQYTVDMSNGVKINGDKQVFYVSSYKGVEFPGKGDSIRIIKGTVQDANGNIQTYEENRYAPMDVNGLPFVVTFKLGPNPFKPGISDIGTSNDIPEQFKGKKGTLIVVSPKSRQGISVDDKSKATGTVSIYDALGNIILKNMAFTTGSQNSDLYFFWDGSNKNGRYVGAGTYQAFVTVKRDFNGRTDVIPYPPKSIGVKR